MSHAIMMINRELRRVPLDFDYSLNKVWSGYFNPYYKECPHCQNGCTSAGIRLNEIVNLLMISGADSLKGKNHPYFQDGYFDFSNIPSKEMADLTSGFSGRRCDTIFGHDACDRWDATKKIIQAAGLNPNEWGICKHCKGEAIDPASKEQYDKWKSTEPPIGEGYQCWETVSEGSPISPVFKTLDKLCQWLANNPKGITANLSKEDWIDALQESCPALHIGTGEKVKKEVLD